MINNKVAIDSNCLTYLIDAINGAAEPTDALKSEKVALFRIFLHMSDTFYVTQTVVDECSAIRNIERKELHENYIAIHFIEIESAQNEQINSRTNELTEVHPGTKDCCIFAEVEEAKINVILTYDTDFLNNLGPVTEPVPGI